MSGVSAELRKGERVVHANWPDEHGVGTITDTREERPGQREYYVAWPMPGSNSVARWEPRDALQPAPVE